MVGCGAVACLYGSCEEARTVLEKQEKNSHIQQQYKAASNFSAWLFGFLCEVAWEWRFL